MSLTVHGLRPAGVESDFITAENLTAGYRDKIVWRDANFTFGRGELVAVIGPNAAGKTTLFRIMLGLQQPIGGTNKRFRAPPRPGHPKNCYLPPHPVIYSETKKEA